jgi:hypothetical protein
MHAATHQVSPFLCRLDIIQAWAVERFKHGADAPAINVFAKEDKETKKLNENLQANKMAFRKGELEQDLSQMTTARKPFTWESLTVRLSACFFFSGFVLRWLTFARAV